MNRTHIFPRRVLVKRSVFGILMASLPNILYAREMLPLASNAGPFEPPPHDRYPAIPLDIAAEVVGVAHFDLERLQELVNPRPELAKANWDWGFGDWESPISAASHVGRPDIVRYLMGKGAVPTIFTYAMFGDYKMVSAMIESYPGVQRSLGPHGISLLQHAKTALDTAGTQKSTARQLVDYLSSLGDADGRQYLDIEEADKEKYIGDYRYGDGKGEGFTIKFNMRKMLSLGSLGKAGGALWRIGENEFTYQGAPSVTVHFTVENGRVISLTVHEPDFILRATKI